jgi:hypothetical protein
MRSMVEGADTAAPFDSPPPPPSAVPLPRRSAAGRNKPRPQQKARGRGRGQVAPGRMRAWGAARRRR